LSFCVGNGKQTEIVVELLWKYLGEYLGVYKPKIWFCEGTSSI
jgi:hypothetical protein